MVKRYECPKCDTNMHHRKPKHLGGKGNTRNMSRVSVTKHRAWHALFGTSTPAEIARIINETWLDPSYEFKSVKR